MIYSFLDKIYLELTNDHSMGAFQDGIFNFSHSRISDLSTTILIQKICRNFKRVSVVLLKVKIFLLNQMKSSSYKGITIPNL